MATWLSRGLVCAAAMLVTRLIQGLLINTFPTRSGLVSGVLLLIFTVGMLMWGLRDGRNDATANPDPDRRDDLAMMWLAAGGVAGVLSGVTAWLISLFVTALYTGGLLSEVSAFAAFTTLVVFVFAIGGVTGGRMFIDRKRAKEPVRHHGLLATDEDGQQAGDTDVFAAVGAGTAVDDSSGEATAVTGAQTSTAAGAVEDYPDAAPTEQLPTATEESAADRPADDTAPTAEEPEAPKEPEEPEEFEEPEESEEPDEPGPAESGETGDTDSAGEPGPERS